MCKLGDENLIKEKTNALSWLQKEEGHISENIRKLQGEIRTLLENVDLKLRQRAKTNSYQLGDHNTIFLCMCLIEKEEESYHSNIR